MMPFLSRVCRPRDPGPSRLSCHKARQGRRKEMSWLTIAMETVYPRAFWRGPPVARRTLGVGRHHRRRWPRRSPRKKQPRGQSSPSIVCVHVVPHVRANGEHSAALLTLPCSHAPRHVGVRRDLTWFLLTREELPWLAYSLSSSCTYTCLSDVQPGWDETGASATRTVTVGWKRARVNVLAPVNLVGRICDTTTVHCQKRVSHGKWLLPSIIHWRVGSYASRVCGHAKLSETKRPKEK
jgi:hypothetical protein